MQNTSKIKTSLTAVPGTTEEWALHMAERGLKIVPLHHTMADGSCTCGRPTKPADQKDRVKGVDYCGSPGKHPVANAWQEQATTEPAIIKKWFKEEPDMNYGCVAGAERFILDIDVKDVDGFETAARLLGVSRGELDSMTFSVKTPSTGQHLYFAADKIYSNTVKTALGEGLDNRSGNGFVVGPGSVLNVDDGFGGKTPISYSIVNLAPTFTPLPNAIKTRMREAVERAANAQTSEDPASINSDDNIYLAREYLKNREEPVIGRGGDEHTKSTSQGVRDFNISEDLCYEMMLDWNETLAEPWEPDGLRVKVRNGYRYADRPMGTRRAMRASMFDAVVGKSCIEDFPAGFFDTPGKSAAAEMESKKSAANPFSLVRVSKDRVEQVAWHIEGLLPEGKAGLIYGDEQVLKSFIAVKIGVDLAMDGVKYHGDPKQKGIEYPIVNHGPVIFIAAEDYKGIDTRSREAILDRDPNTDPAKVPFFLLDAAPNMTDTDDVDLLIKAIEEATNGKPPVAIFIDTAVYAMGESDEDKAKDVKNAYLGAKTIINHFKGVPTVFFIHHTGKDASKGARGSSNWTRSSEVRYLVKGIGQIEVKDGHRLIKYPVSAVAYNEKMKGQALQPPISYKTRRIVFDVQKTVNGNKTTGKDSTLLLDVVPFREAAQAAGVMTPQKIVRLVLDMLDDGRVYSTKDICDFANNHDLLVGNDPERRHENFQRQLQKRLKEGTKEAEKFREEVRRFYTIIEKDTKKGPVNEYRFIGQGGRLGDWKKFTEARAKEKDQMEKGSTDADSFIDGDEDYGEV